MADPNQLHACRRCRTRKQKCDKAIPRCSPCDKSNVDCLFLDPATGEEYSRQSIADLEKLEADLRNAVENGAEPQARAELPVSNQEPHQPANESYIGEGSGINVIETIFSNPRFQPQLLKHLLARPHIQQPLVAPASLPSIETARFLFTTYLHESHVQKPFLMEADVLSLLERIYSHANEDDNSAEDLFNFYLICATSAVPLRRRGHIQEHPYGFFLTARAQADRINILSGIEAVQSLLLLARFGVYFHTGASTWEIGRVCMSICASLELHLKPLQPVPAIEEQKRRRVFWESYVLDRHTSMILGRPFAIADEDIRVPLPVELSDAEVATRDRGTLDMDSGPSASVPSPMAVFNCFVRLRRITARIHTTFFTRAKKATGIPLSSRQLAGLGDLYGRFQELLDELDAWRNSVPCFDQTEPQSLYHRPQWYEFLCQKERLFLVRAMINAASTSNKSPPKDLCRMCSECAAAVISLYADMFLLRQINCTRHYFQILLTAGLFLAYFTSNGASTARHGAMSDKSETKRTLAVCSKTLHGLAAEMLDARPYATVFDLICETTFPGWKIQSEPSLNPESIQASTIGDQISLPQMSSNLEGLFNIEIQDYGNAHDASLNMNDFAYPDSLPSDWTYSPGQMFADVEAYVNQFATGDFSTDALLDPASWNVQPDISDGFG